MRQGIKKTGLVIGIGVILLCMVITTSYCNHKMQLAKEDDLFVPNGEIVQVNGHDMHLYTEGQGEETLVFMSGGGTCSPVLDFKNLYSMLSDQYKICVVEKIGYGFSENADIPRDIDAILDDTRKALSQIGLEPPYILVPHSMSGIEALYWAQQYPSEVKGIIGLDMAVPKAYEEYQVNNFMLTLSAFGSKIGITRFFPAIVNSSSAIRNGELTEKEKGLYQTVFYRRTLTKAMFQEVKQIKLSAEKVNENGIPDMPMLFFISNGQGTGWDLDQWINYQTSYIDSINKGKYVKLNSGHYVHNAEAEKIAEETKKFLGVLFN